MQVVQAGLHSMYQEVIYLMSKSKVTCTVEFTEGAQERITQAFVDLYYDILDGIHEGPLPTEIRTNKDETA